MNHNDKNNEQETITLASIEELRAALGAEADIEDLGQDRVSALAPSSTSMCGDHPWDR